LPCFKIALAIDSDEVETLQETLGGLSTSVNPRKLVTFYLTEYAALKEVLEVTDGNLGTHLSRLEEAGYILVEKTFVNKKPHTYLAVTARGRSAFSEHVEALQKILQVSLPVAQYRAARPTEGMQGAT
jgi:DNA-binding HxlR family transcriptional regulator